MWVPRTRNIKMFEHKNETTNFEMETMGGVQSRIHKAGKKTNLWEFISRIIVERNAKRNVSKKC